ncbi:MAG: hypothetical protein R8K20_12155 [Gallionellaceae bacterium]
MMFNKSDLTHLKGSLFIFAFSLLVCGSTIWLCKTYRSHSAAQLQDAQKQVTQAQNKLTRAQNDLDNFSSYASEYASLIERKIVAQERRLDWMEELEKQQHHVLLLKYTIAPQQPYVLKPTRDIGNLEIHLSSIDMQMNLLHETQLMSFIEALHSAGWFMIERCTLERADTATETELTAGVQLKADCTGGWITIKHREAL